MNLPEFSQDSREAGDYLLEAKEMASPHSGTNAALRKESSLKLKTLLPNALGSGRSPGNCVAFKHTALAAMLVAAFLEAGPGAATSVGRSIYLENLPAGVPRETADSLLDEAREALTAFEPNEPATPLAEQFALLQRQRVRVTVDWRSQYTGQTGRGYALPQKEEFAFFYFSDPNNPEVFVKVLDFTSASPFILFYAGLTDFEYTVTFENVCTGQTWVSTKPAGSMAGGLDNVALTWCVERGSGVRAAGVTTLNGLAGDLNLIAGSNVSIQGSGKNITISTSGGGTAGVTSLNGLAGQVTLASSSNINIQQAGNTLYLSAPLTQGPKGDTGAQGPQGIQGPQGPAGPQGVPGPSAAYAAVCRLSTAVQVNLPNAAGVTVPFTTCSPSSAVSNLGNSNFRYTVPSTGLYQIHARITVSVPPDQNTGHLDLHLLQNGANLAVSRTYTPGSSIIHSAAITEMVRLMQGDSIQVMAAQHQTSSKINIDGSNPWNAFSIARIGD